MPQSDPNSAPPTPSLLAMLKPNHPLLRLAATIDWDSLEAEFANVEPETGRPPLPTCFMVGLHYLKAMYNESDESVVQKWIENPYWQYFCGEQVFQHDFPCHPTSLVKWRSSSWRRWD